MHARQNATATALVFAVVLLIAVLLIAGQRNSAVIPTTLPGAVAALEYMGDWAKWMAGIQTAALAALVYIVFEKDSVKVRSLPRAALVLGLIGFVFLGVALFCCAWVLSSLPSQAIRVHAVADSIKTAAAIAGDTVQVDTSSSFDVYEQPLFAKQRWISLGYLLTAVHWLWGVGLLSLGALIGMLTMRTDGGGAAAAENSGEREIRPNRWSIDEEEL